MINDIYHRYHKKYSETQTCKILKNINYDDAVPENYSSLTNLSC